jgi:hypothetical protein
VHEDGIGKHQSQKAWDIGESVWCRNCNLVSLSVFAGHLRKREITLAIISIVLYLLVSYKHLTTYIISYILSNLRTSHQFIVS